MQFMTQPEAEQLASLIRQESEQEGLDVSVDEIFSTSELEFNRDSYPAGSYLVSVTLHWSDGRPEEEWIHNLADWQKVKGWIQE